MEGGEAVVKAGRGSRRGVHLGWKEFTEFWKPSENEMLVFNSREQIAFKAERDRIDGKKEIVVRRKKNKMKPT